MGSEVKLVRVYAEDWKELNDLLLVEQARQKKRLSFADLIHELVELKKQVDANMKELVKGGQTVDSTL